MKTYYRVTSMGQLQKAYDIIHPDKITMLHRYINKTYQCEDARKTFKRYLDMYHLIYFDVVGSSRCWLPEKDPDITIIDIGKEDRYNL